MAYSYTISPENAPVYIQFNGTTQMSEIINCIREVVFDNHFESDYGVLIEIRAQWIPLASELRQIAELIVRLEAQFRNSVALVATGTLLKMTASMVRHHIVERTDIEIEIFENTNEAIDWLKGS